LKECPLFVDSVAVKLQVEYVSQESYVSMTGSWDDSVGTAGSFPEDKVTGA